MPDEPTSPQPSPEPKLIIDEDWKSQVQAEKARLEEELRARQKPGSTRAAAAPPEAAPSGPSAQGPLPPASLQTLVTMLATQVMASLGQIPLPGQTQPSVDLPQAKHFIDTLQVIEEKTRGNLTPSESQLLVNLLHELRMAYVTIEAHAAAGPPA